VNFYTTILGSGAALPTTTRHCSAQVVNVNGFRLLLDCGENTQTQLRVFRQRLQSINHIFITHLHGDHFFGLPGLISSQHLCGRKDPVDIFAPAGIARAMNLLLEVSGSHIGFEIRYHELVHSEGCLPLLENDRCRVSAFALDHSVPAYGYLIEEVSRGTNPARRYAYCSDTGYTEAFLPFIEGVDLLCLECTFGQAFAPIAAEKKHLTAPLAATLAAKAAAGELLLTHISARYRDPAPLLEEASALFPCTAMAADGLVCEVRYTKNRPAPAVGEGLVEAASGGGGCGEGQSVS